MRFLSILGMCTACWRDVNCPPGEELKVHLQRWLQTTPAISLHTHATPPPPHQEVESVSPSLKPWLTLCPALKNRMQ